MSSIGTTYCLPEKTFEAWTAVIEGEAAVVSDGPFIDEFIVQVTSKISLRFRLYMGDNNDGYVEAVWFDEECEIDTEVCDVFEPDSEYQIEYKDDTYTVTLNEQ